LKILYNSSDWLSFAGFTEETLNPYTNINSNSRTKYTRNYVADNATLTATKTASQGNAVALVFNKLLYPFKTTAGVENNCLLLVDGTYDQVYSSAVHTTNRGVVYWDVTQSTISSLAIAFAFASSGSTTFAQISNIFHGNVLDLVTNGFDLAFTFEYIDKTDKVYNDYNVAFTQNQKTASLRLDLSIRNMNKTELSSVLAWINACGKTKPFVLFVDETATIITSKYDLGAVFMFHDIDKVHHKSFGLYDISFSIIEVI